jgi:DNA-binding beta-propeller fold protein YncE
MILNPDESSLIMADIGSGAIVRISTANASVSKLASVADPHGVALLPSTELLATNNSANSIDRVPPSGSPVSSFSADPSFNFPDDLVVEPSKCGGQLPTVVGTTGNDVLRGSPFADIISGLEGRTC